MTGSWTAVSHSAVHGESSTDAPRYDEAAGRRFVEEFRRRLAASGTRLSYQTDFDRCGGPASVARRDGLLRIAGPEDVRAFLAGTEWLSPGSWHHCFDAYGCELSGVVEAESGSYRFSVDVGGAGTLALGDAWTYFGHPGLADCDADGEPDPPGD